MQTVARRHVPCVCGRERRGACKVGPHADPRVQRGARHRAPARDRARAQCAAPARDSRACQTSLRVGRGKIGNIGQAGDPGGSDPGEARAARARPGAPGGVGRGALISPRGAGRGALASAPERPCQPCALGARGGTGLLCCRLHALRGVAGCDAACTAGLDAAGPIPCCQP